MSHQGPILPPFSSIQARGPPGSSQPSNVPSARYQVVDQRSLNKQPIAGVKRPAPSSNVASTDSSDVDEDENGELPASGLVAPWEVLRGLADVAIERAAKVGFDIFSIASFALANVLLYTLRETNYNLFRKMEMGASHTAGQELPLQRGIGIRDPRNVGRFVTNPSNLQMVRRRLHPPNMTLTGGSHQSLPKVSSLNPKRGNFSTCGDTFRSVFASFSNPCSFS